MIEPLIHIIHLLLAKILELELALRLNTKIIACNQVTIKDYEQASMDFLDKLDIAEQENEILKKLLLKATEKKVIKTSRNSDLPPSKDTKKSHRRNSRVKSGKKPGGQVGHKGYTLEMFEEPTEIIEFVPEVCPKCGKSLNLSKKKLVSSKQEIDIPPSSPIIRQFD